VRIEFTLPGLPKSPNGAHGSWQAAAGERKKWRNWSRLAALGEMRKGGKFPLEKIRLTITRHSLRPMDYDNRVMAAKSAVDGLVDAGLIADDTDQFIVERKYPWEPAPRGKGKIVVVVEELKSPETGLALDERRVNSDSSTGVAAARENSIEAPKCFLGRTTGPSGCEAEWAALEPSTMRGGKK